MVDSSVSYCHGIDAILLFTHYIQIHVPSIFFVTAILDKVC
jgi:hypothetical protein